MLDIIILANGPGEVTTWVRPVVKALREELGWGEEVRISVILSPCPHGTGKEAAIASSYSEVNRVQEAEYFFPFLLLGKTAANWDWRDKGVVVFLGGDQFFTAAIALRLGYKSVVYAEWDARWYGWIDRFGAMKQEVINKVPLLYRNKFAVVGDLMADVELAASSDSSSFNNEEIKEERELIGLLPGSKGSKLAQGVPLMLAIAELIQQQRPQTQFIIPVAPTIDLETIARFANPQTNPVLAKIGGTAAELIISDNQPFLKTAAGLKVQLITQFPANQILARCSLCLTTVGANTAQLGALGVPMIILLPTQQLDAMRSWDGLPGILANLPGVGSAFAKLINWLVVQLTLKQGRLYSWPNIWAGEEIVPELVGELQAETVAEMVLDFLANRRKLTEIKASLRRVRGETGAARKLAAIVKELIASQ